MIFEEKDLSRYIISLPDCLINWVDKLRDKLGNHCVKSVRIRSYSGPHFPAFGLNTERYGVSVHIQLECGKMRTRITPNTNTLYAENMYFVLICFPIYDVMNFKISLSFLFKPFSDMIKQYRTKI